MGNWFIADFLQKYTDVKLVNCDPLDAKNTTFEANDVENICKKFKCVILQVKWIKNYMEQNHMIAYNNGFIYDSLLNAPYPYSEFLGKNCVYKIQHFQYQPQFLNDTLSIPKVPKIGTGTRIKELYVKIASLEQTIVEQSELIAALRAQIASLVK